MSSVVADVGAFAAALVYAIATFLLRRSVLAGVGLRGQLFAVGTFIALGSIPLLVSAGLPDVETLGYALIAGVAFGLGQFLVAVSIIKGDASVQTSLMGTKVLWVALISAWLFGISFPSYIWASALLVVVAVFLIGFTRSAREHGSPASVGAALASAISYAVTDSMLGSGRFGGLGSPFYATVIFAAGLAIVAVAGVIGLLGAATAGSSGTAIPKKARIGILVASALFALQFFGFASILSGSGEAARMNVLFSSRGLWSVALVWILVDRKTAERPPAMVLAQRAAGAVALIVAVILSV